MSRLFGPVRQNGYVVPDLERSVDQWLAAGVGPWWVFRHVDMRRFRYRDHGTLSDVGLPDVSIALSASGSMQMELICPHDDTPSLYREFLDRHPGGGLQHLGFFPDDYADRHRAVSEAGWQIGHEGQIGTIEFSYWRLPGETEHIFELADLDATQRSLFAHIDEATRSWDGSTRPLRGDR